MRNRSVFLIAVPLVAFLGCSDTSELEESIARLNNRVADIETQVESRLQADVRDDFDALLDELNCERTTARAPSPFPTTDPVFGDLEPRIHDVDCGGDNDLSYLRDDFDDLLEDFDDLLDKLGCYRRVREITFTRYLQC